MDSTFYCPICLEDLPKEKEYITECNHTFCEDCMKKLNEEILVLCPLCRKIMKHHSEFNIEDIVYEYLVRPPILFLPFTIFRICMLMLFLIIKYYLLALHTLFLWNIYLTLVICGSIDKLSPPKKIFLLFLISFMCTIFFLFNYTRLDKIL